MGGEKECGKEQSEREAGEEVEVCNGLLMPVVKDPVRPGHLPVVASQNCLFKGRLSGTFITGVPAFHCSCWKGGGTLTHFPIALVYGFSKEPVAETRKMSTMHLRWHTENRLTSGWDQKMKDLVQRALSF